MALQALELGAVEVLAKPGSAFSVGDLGVELAEKIRAAARVRFDLRKIQDATPPPSPARLAPLAQTTDKIIAIGASTGGTEAIKEVLLPLPQNTPGIVIVQHMPPKFTTAFPERLNQQCALEVKEAQDGDTVVTGRTLIAPGNYHMLLRRSGARYYVQVKSGPPVHHQRPSVDVLFNSAAQSGGANWDHPDGHGGRRSRGAPGHERAGSLYHRPGRTLLCGLRHAPGGHQTGGHPQGLAAQPHP